MKHDLQLSLTIKIEYSNNFFSCGYHQPLSFFFFFFFLFLWESGYHQPWSQIISKCCLHLLSYQIIWKTNNSEYWKCHIVKIYNLWNDAFLFVTSFKEVLEIGNNQNFINFQSGQFFLTISFKINLAIYLISTHYFILFIIYNQPLQQNCFI